LVCAGLFLSSCGIDSTDGNDQAEVVSLDGAGDPSFTVLGQGDSELAHLGTSEEGEKVSKAALPNSGTAKEPVPKVEPASFSTSGVGGARALNDWHRSLSSGRNSSMSRFSPAAAAALKDFAAMTGSDVRAYRASLKLEQPAALGEEFSQLAMAYGAGGLDGLVDALKPTPDPSPAWMAWTEALAVQGIQQGKYSIGGRALGKLIQGMLVLGYSRDRVLELQLIAHSVGRQTGNFLPFDDYEVLPGESLYVVRAKMRKQGRKLNYRWIADFNHKSKYGVGEGETLKIPVQELSVIAWRGARVLVVFAGDYPIRVFPCSAGRKGQETPLGSFTLGICEEKPAYYPSGKPAIPYGNPNNPLGERWMGYQESPSYGIHGTNSESTIGSYETEGCIRMHNTDVLELFDLLPVGAPVEIRS
jgi:hypothetical protein